MAAYGEVLTWACGAFVATILLRSIGIPISRWWSQFSTERFWSFQTAAIAYHLTAVVWLIICAWEGVPHLGLLVATFFILVAARVLRLDPEASRAVRPEGASTLVVIPSQRPTVLETHAARWFWWDASSASQHRTVSAKQGSM